MAKSEHLVLLILFVHRVVIVLLLLLFERIESLSIILFLQDVMLLSFQTHLCPFLFEFYSASFSILFFPLFLVMHLRSYLINHEDLSVFFGQIRSTWTESWAAISNIQYSKKKLRVLSFY